MTRPAPFLLAFSLVLAVGPFPILPVSRGAAQAPPHRDDPRTLRLANRDVVTFRSRLLGVSPEARVRRARENVESLRPRELLEPVRVVSVVFDGHPGVSFHLGERSLFVMLEDDVDPLGNLSFEEEAHLVESRLRDAFAAIRSQRDPKILVRGITRTSIATVVFAALLAILRALASAADRRLRRFAEAKTAGQSWATGRLRAFLETWMPRVVLLFSAAFAIFLTYLYLTFAFSQFPITLPFADALGEFLRQRAIAVARGAIAAIPNLVTVFFVVLVARLASSGLENLFSSVLRGQLQVPGLHRDTVGATRRIAISVIWLFALAMAYPYLPGAGTDAFRGLSVFVGLLVSFGSTGIVNHLMSGLVLVYSRAMRNGDYVRIGQVEGWVQEVGALSVKIRTVSHEEVTVPNATAVGTPIENYSKLAPTIGAAVSTTVTIGYDTPWRQVQALLELAASRTPNLKTDPKPYVIQTALSDFYVEYRLVAQVKDPDRHPWTLSDLNAAVQDAFNEYGVQIMSPHFVLQPREAVVVPKAKEHAAPAPAPSEPTGTSR